MSDTPRTDALIERHKAEAADADRGCLHELSVAQIKELIAHTRQIERGLAKMEKALRTLRQDGCENYTSGIGSCFRNHRTPDAEFGADRCCASCVADAALASASGTPQENEEAK
jgi:hypothetical protein